MEGSISLTRLLVHLISKIESFASHDELRVISSYEQETWQLNLRYVNSKLDQLKIRNILNLRGFELGSIPGTRYLQTGDPHA